MNRMILLWLMVITSILLGIGPAFLPDGIFVNIPMHASTTGCEAVLALTAAAFLLLRDDKYPWKLWVCLDLTVIGILILFHSCMAMGDAFIETNVLAYAIGAMVSTGVWWRKQFPLNIRWKIVLLTVVISIISAIVITHSPIDAFDDTTLELNSFSLFANIFAAICFSITALFFFIESVKSKDVGPMLFLMVCMLNASASLISFYCDTWHHNWWAWHILHIASKIMIIVYMTYESSKEYFSLRETERDLLKSNEELSQFAYVASHDLKAPLRAVANLSTWIAEDIQEGKDVSKSVTLIKNRIIRMENLINGLLEYSRIGRMHTEVELIDLQKLMKELEETHSVKITIPKPLPVIEYNSLRIGQVFSNLVGNSIKHHHDINNIQISVLCEEKSHEYILSVVDNGPGIAPQYHQKIFEIFQTLRPKDEVESTGIGLSLVKKIIEDNDGKIWVESQEGFGSKFSFTIPK